MPGSSRPPWHRLSYSKRSQPSAGRATDPYGHLPPCHLATGPAPRRLRALVADSLPRKLGSISRVSRYEGAKRCNGDGAGRVASRLMAASGTAAWPRLAPQCAHECARTPRLAAVRHIRHRLHPQRSPWPQLLPPTPTHPIPSGTSGCRSKKCMTGGEGPADPPLKWKGCMLFVPRGSCSQQRADCCNVLGSAHVLVAKDLWCNHTGGHAERAALYDWACN